MIRLAISDDLKLPIDAVTQRFAFLGRVGSGKSYAATKLAELMFEAGAQIVVIDPVGVWYGLRVAGDGKPLSIPVFGGLHGDIPLTPASGGLLADLIVDRGISVVLDVSQFEIDADKARFARDFAARFFFRKKASASAVHVFLEEAQEFVPQNPSHGEEHMLHDFSRMAKLGRNFGIGLSLISQRPQEINKKVLNLTECLLAFQMTGTHERKAIEEWASTRGIEDRLRDVLPSLKVGAPHVWSPQWLEISKVVRIATKRTADVSATPKAGVKAKVRTLSSVDLKELGETMAATVEQAKANDPKVLKAEVARLKSELTKKFIATPQEKFREIPAVDKTTLKRVEKAIERAEALYSLEVGYIKELKGHRDEIAKIIDIWSNRLQPVLSGIGNLQTEIKRASRTPSAAVGQQRAGESSRATPPRRPEPLKKAPPQGSNGEAPKLGPGERKCMVAIAQAGDDGVSKTVLSQLTAFARSTRDKYVQKLRSAGYVTEEGERVIRTDEGVVWIGDDYEELPTGYALFQYWMAKLPIGEARILQYTQEHYPDSVSKEEFCSELKFARSTRDKYIQKLGAKRIIIETTLHNEPAIKMSDILADQE